MSYLIVNPGDCPSWEHIEDISLENFPSDLSLNSRRQGQQISNGRGTPIVKNTEEIKLVTEPPSNPRRRFQYQDTSGTEGPVTKNTTSIISLPLELPTLPKRQVQNRNRPRPERPTEYITNIFQEHFTTFTPLPNANDYFVRCHSDSISPTPPPDPFSIDREGSLIADGDGDGEKGKQVEGEDKEKEVNSWKRDSKMDGVEEGREVEELGGRYSKKGTQYMDEEDQDWVWMAKYT